MISIITRRLKAFFDMMSPLSAAICLCKKTAFLCCIKQAIKLALRKRFFHSYFIIIFLCTRIFFLVVSKLPIFPCKNTSCIFDIFIYTVIRRQKTLKPSHRRGFTVILPKWTLYLCISSIYFRTTSSIFSLAAGSATYLPTRGYPSSLFLGGLMRESNSISPVS